MENTTGNSISELIKTAEEKGMQIIVVGEDAAGGKHAALLAKLEQRDNVLIVPIKSLTEEDQKKINEYMDKPKNTPFERPPLPITDTYKLGTHEVFVSDEKKTSFEGFNKRKKLKGYQKGKR